MHLPYYINDYFSSVICTNADVSCAKCLLCIYRAHTVVSENDSFIISVYDTLRHNGQNESDRILWNCPIAYTKATV